jgi:hypothetical protein
LQALFLLIYTPTSLVESSCDRDDVLVVRVWDAFADLAAGRLVDLTHSPVGVQAVPAVRLASAAAVEYRLNVPN